MSTEMFDKAMAKLHTSVNTRCHVEISPSEAWVIAEAIKSAREVREILAGADVCSLPRDYSLQAMAANRMDELRKYRDQVIDTIQRAEKAEAASEDREYLIDVLRRLLKADLILGDEGEDLDLRREVRGILQADDLDHGRVPLCQDIIDAIFRERL
jgi:hypothetical protein